MANVGSGLLDLFDPDAWVSLVDAVWSPGWWKLAVPSVMFMFQANAQYVASGNLSVPVFQLAYQLKVSPLHSSSYLALADFNRSVARFPPPRCAASFSSSAPSRTSSGSRSCS